jgi:hypothetical protein
MYIDLYIDLYMNSYFIKKFYGCQPSSQPIVTSSVHFYKLFPDFSVCDYKYFNPDLNLLNDIELMSHYYHQGQHEGRIYSQYLYKINHSNDTFFKPLPQISQTDISPIPLNPKINPDFNAKLNQCFKNSSAIYSLKTFYRHFPNFRYFEYRKYLNNSQISEVDTIINWYKFDFNYMFKNDFQKKNIIIYPHDRFQTNDGGVLVQYYLAQILDQFGERVRISANSTQNEIFNNFYEEGAENEINIENSIVIYCEGIETNPLKATHVVRWLLSELGKNVPQNRYLQWDRHDIVYYFNYEPKFDSNRNSMCDSNRNSMCDSNRNSMCDNNGIFKLLSVIYLDPNLQSTNQALRGKYCHTFRKFRKFHKESYHKNQMIHPTNSFEITRQHDQSDYIKIFNQYEYFVAYDPLTFLSIIAPLCGCLSIIYPVENVNYDDWLKTTAVYRYCQDQKIKRLYGIAYGDSHDEITFAKSTLSLVREQWDDITRYLLETSVVPFINDIHHWNDNQNNVGNNFE